MGDFLFSGKSDATKWVVGGTQGTSNATGGLFSELPASTSLTYLLQCPLGLSTIFTVDKNGNGMGVGNSSVGGTITVTGNTTLNGVLT